jgi:hypothetical protein
MADLTELDVAAMREAEVERCARLNEALATRWEASAAKIRREGTFVTGGWIFPKMIRVALKWERAARDLEAAAHGLRTCAQMMRGGYDPLKVPGNTIVATDPATGGPIK